jgi:hypothetical protein
MAVTSTITRYLNKGDYVELFGFQSESASETYSTVVGVNYLTIAKRSSPQTVAASEIVACRYTSNSGQTLSSALTIALMEDKQSDTHNAYNTSTGYYTVPQSGFYNIKFRYWTAALTPTADTFGIVAYIYINNVRTAQGVRRPGTTANSSYMSDVFMDSVYLSKGDLVDARTQTSVIAGLTMNTDSTTNEFSIHKINGVS